MSGTVITGDFGKLKRALAKVEKARRGDLKLAVVKNLAAEAITQVSLGFRQSRDPYGNPWAPLATRDGQILVDTARMRNSFSVTLEDQGFRVGTNVRYMPFHQYGSRVRVTRGKRKSRSKVGRLPARPMLPTGELGQIWSQALEAASTATLRKFWRFT
jgi:phage gpG-like protein